MVVNKITKTIWAEHWERHSVCNYLQHCIDTKDLKDWHVNFVLPNTPEMEEYRKMESQQARISRF